MFSFFTTSNMTLPPEGPRVIPVNIDMLAQQEYDIDVTEMTQNGYISYISGAFFDNADNAQDVTVSVSGSNQRIIIPASRQMIMPLFAVNPPKFNFSQAAPGDLLRVFFVNFPVFAWNSPTF